MNLRSCFWVKEGLESAPQYAEPGSRIDDKHLVESLRIVISINLLQPSHKLPRRLAKILKPHSLHVQNRRARVDMLLGSDRACGELDHKTPLELLDVIPKVPIDRRDLHQLVGINFPEPLDIHGPPFFIHAVVTVRVVSQDVVDLLELEVVDDRVGAELFPPLDHISPHCSCFLHVELPRFQEPEHHVVVVVFGREELLHDQRLSELVDGLKLLDVADVFDGD